MADYWSHWLEVGNALSKADRPEIFQVNWFRKDANGKFIWPGFSDNIRVVDWIIQRLEGEAHGVETAIGVTPAQSELNLVGVAMSDASLSELFEVNQKSWLAETDSIAEYYESFGSHVPPALNEELSTLKSRLSEMV